MRVRSQGRYHRPYCGKMTAQEGSPLSYSLSRRSLPCSGSRGGRGGEAGGGGSQQRRQAVGEHVQQPPGVQAEVLGFEVGAAAKAALASLATNSQQLFPEAKSHLDDWPQHARQARVPPVQY